CCLDCFGCQTPCSVPGRRATGLGRCAGGVCRPRSRAVDSAGAVHGGAVLPLPYSAPARLMRRWLAVLLLAISGSAAAVERVVSLAPSLSEIVVELGSADLLVGVLDAGERPSELSAVPSVGRYGQLDMER